MTDYPERLVEELCRHCEKNHAAPKHTCPFTEEIHNDFDTLCTCCSDCEHEYVMDI